MTMEPRESSSAFGGEPENCYPRRRSLDRDAIYEWCVATGLIFQEHGKSVLSLDGAQVGYVLNAILMHEWKGE